MEMTQTQKDLVEFANMKSELMHLRRMLGRVKGSIEIFKHYCPKEKHFDGVLKELEDNGVKGYLDAGKEYDNYIKGVKNA